MTSLKKLATLDFSDLLIEDTGSFLKHLFGASQVLTPVEEDLIIDLAGIKKELEEKGSDLNEFPLIYDGIIYRVSKSKTVNGPLYVMRKGRSEIPDINKIGLPTYLINKLLSPERKDGLILFSGQMGSGKTTTACSLITAWLAKFGGHAVALEDPPELPLQKQCTENGRCYQIDISGKSMADEIVKTLRRAADLIFLGELRDSNAISEALRASINGHLIVATIHASGPKEALQKIITMGSRLDGNTTMPTLAQGFEAVIHLDFDPIEKRLSVQFLFAEGQHEHDSEAVRAKIREGQFHTLASVINAQRNKMTIEMRSQRKN